MVNSKRHYRINPETLQLERIEHGFRYWLRRSGGYILGGFGIGMIFFYVFLYFFPSPREASLMQYNRNLTAEMAVLEKQVTRCRSSSPTSRSVMTTSIVPSWAPNPFRSVPEWEPRSRCLTTTLWHA